MTKKLKSLLLFAIFAGGYASLSLEILAIRQLAAFVGSTAITTSIIIGVFLAFMSVGYYAGTSLKVKKTSLRNLLYYGFLIISVIIVLAVSYPIVTGFFYFLYVSGVRSIIAQTFIYSFLFLSFAPFLFGLITSFSSRYLHRYHKDYTGKVMAVDTVGSVFGSVLTTLILMPFIGVNHTVILVTGVTLLCAFIIKPDTKVFYIFVFAAVINSNLFLNKHYQIVSNNAVSTISIHDVPEEEKRLMVMEGGRSSQIAKDPSKMFSYIRYIEENFIDVLPRTEKKDILILGAGGFTLGHRDNFHRYVFVDIDKDLKAVAEEHFLYEPLSDNKTFVVEDAAQYVKNTDQTFDLIVLDTYSARGFLPEFLITKEYFENVKSRLKPDGIVIINVITSPNFSSDFSRNIDRTLRTVFHDNMSRQVIGPFNGFDPNKKNASNVLYFYYHREKPSKIYTYDQNTYFYDSEFVY